MKTRLFESGYPCFEIESDAKALNHKTIKIGDSTDKMPNKKLPPPLSYEDCLSKRTQKDAADIKPTPKRLTFDDLETAPKAPIRTRQGDSMTTSVTKKVNTPVTTTLSGVVDGTCKGAGAGKFAALPVGYGEVTNDRKIAELPISFMGNPHAVVIDNPPEELFKGMWLKQPEPKLPTDMNQVLECRGALNCAPIITSQLVNVNFRQAPPLVY